MKQAKRTLALVVCLALMAPALSMRASAGGTGASGALLPDGRDGTTCSVSAERIGPEKIREGAESAKDDAEEFVKEKAGEAQSFAERMVQSAVSAAESTGEWLLDIINSAVGAILNLLFGDHGGSAGAPGETIRTAAVAGAKIAAGKSILLAVVVASTLALTVAAVLSKVALAPLYCHISEGKALENPQRKKIYEAIKANPGIRISELAKIAGIGWGATVYHIMVLEKGNYIASRIGPRNAGLFENNGRYTKEERRARALLGVGKSSAVFDYIRANPGASSGKISRALDLSGPTTSWYTGKLCEYGLIKKVRNGKSVAHYPADEASGITCCGAASYGLDAAVAGGASAH